MQWTQPELKPLSHYATTSTIAPKSGKHLQIWFAIIFLFIFQNQKKNGHHKYPSLEAPQTTYPSVIVTWSIITELLILTFSPIVVCFPITDFFIDTFSPIDTLSSTMQSFPTWKDNNQTK